MISIITKSHTDKISVENRLQRNKSIYQNNRLQNLILLCKKRVTSQQQTHYQTQLSLELCKIKSPPLEKDEKKTSLSDKFKNKTRKTKHTTMPIASNSF